MFASLAGRQQEDVSDAESRFDPEVFRREVVRALNDRCETSRLQFEERVLAALREAKFPDRPDPFDYDFLLKRELILAAINAAGQGPKVTLLDPIPKPPYRLERVEQLYKIIGRVAAIEKHEWLEVLAPAYADPDNAPLSRQMATQVLWSNDVFWPSEHWHGILAGYGHLTAFIEGRFRGEYRPEETLFKHRDLLEDKWSDLRYRFLLRDPIAFTSWLYLVYPDERGTIDNLPVLLSDLDAALQRAEAEKIMIWMPPAQRSKPDQPIRRPLPADVAAMLRELEERGGRPGQYLAEFLRGGFGPPSAGAGTER